MYIYIYIYIYIYVMNICLPDRHNIDNQISVLFIHYFVFVFHKVPAASSKFTDWLPKKS